jgi:hypothetical protein
MTSTPARSALGRRAFAAGLVGGGLAAAAGVRQAAAGRAWCRIDPVVIIGGELADVFVSAPLLSILKVNGPNEMVVTVPKGVPAHVVVPDLVGFGYGTDFRFAESSNLRQTDEGIEVKVEVYVPARSDIPVRAEFAPRLLGILRPDTAEGTANEWVKLRTRL